MTFGDYLSAFRYIPYQLEQLSAEHGIFRQLKKILSGGVDAWDYSRENIGFLRNLGITARHLPVGYHESLEQVPQSRKKDIDVLFFGSLGSRRQVIIDTLQKGGKARVKALFGTYGKERDENS